MRFVTGLGLLAILVGTAHAGAALDDNSAASTPPPTTRTSDPNAAPDTLQTSADKVEYGVDLRLRQVFVPSGIIGLFVARAAGGASNTGFGVDLVRRRGNLELQLGFEFENITPQEGVYINSGNDVAQGDSADYLLSPAHAGSDFGWFTIEFTFLNHAPINKYLSFRYGGGAGLGILTGGIYRWDVAQCNPGATNSNPEPGCVPNTAGNPTGPTPMRDNGGGVETAPVKYDTPPVFPVVNAIIGLQIRPIPKAVINIEGGIRTLPFIGISAGYFFN